MFDADTPLMHARAGYDGGFVQFMNDEDFPVKNCNLGLYLKNGVGYVLQWPALAAHSDTGPLTVSSFIQLDVATRHATGEPLRDKPDAWIIFCDSPAAEKIGGGGDIK